MNVIPTQLINPYTGWIIHYTLSRLDLHIIFLWFPPDSHDTQHQLALDLPSPQVLVVEQ